MPLPAARAVVVVVGLAALALLGVVGTQPRQLAGYQVVDGEVVQVSLECASLLAGGGLDQVGAPTGVDVPQDEGLEDDPGLACPEEGPLWIAVLGTAAVLVVGAVIWAWGYLGHRAGRTAD